MPRRADLESLYDTHAAGVFHYLRGIVKNEADAKDLLQEFFIKLGRLEWPEAVGNERAYLLRIAHHQAIDWMRRHRTRRVAEESCAGETIPMFARDNDPDAGEFARRAEAALGELPVEQRTIAELKLWQGLTFEEIAVAQQIPLNTAASRYRYAIDKLRTLLRPLYDELQP